jgi:putative membrane protein
MANRFILFLLSALVATPVVEALAQGERPEWMWHTSWGWGHMIFGMAMMILFWGAIIALIVLLVRWLWGHAGPQSPSPTAHKTPLDILKERFARGEIDKEEYEERRKLLSE